MWQSHTNNMLKEKEKNEQCHITEERMDRYTWVPEDLQVYNSLDELKTDISAQGGRFIDYTKE